MKKLSLFLGVAALAGLFSSCQQTSSLTGGSAKAYMNYDVSAKKPTNPSNVRVKVSLSKQLVYVMEGDKALLVSPVGVGAPSTPTPQGNFRIFNKEAKHRANSHGWAYNSATGSYARCKISEKPAGTSFRGTPMGYWCEFKQDYGFHTGWIWNSPRTHGCLRLHRNIAPKFFSLVQVGTPVNIATSQPEDAGIGRSVPRPPDPSAIPDQPAAEYSGAAFADHNPASFES